MSNTQPTHSYGDTILTREHICTTIATTGLRFRTDLMRQAMASFMGPELKTLEQAHQCIHCGKSEWREVPTICEEGAK
jgi:hypothetical protein